MSDDLPKESKVCVWTVEFSSPSENRWRYNATVTVIATSAQRALNMVME